VGQLLKVMDKAEGGRPTEKTCHAAGQVSTLPELGITRNQSSQRQKLADVDDEAFEEAVKQDRPSTSGIIGASSKGPNRREVCKRQRALIGLIEAGTAQVETMDGKYAWEKLYTAVLILATGTGPIQQRLEHAYVPHLMSLRSDHHFPWPDLRQRFEDLMEEMAPEGRFDIALASWSELDLRRIVEGIVGVFNGVARRLGRVDGIPAMHS